TLQTDDFQIAGDAPLKIPGRQWLLEEDFNQRVHGRCSLKWRPSGEALVQDGAQGVNVCRRPDLRSPPGCLLGCHVVRSAKDRAADGPPCRGIELFGKTKVGDLRLAGSRKEHVAWLQITMDNTSLVSRMHGSSQALHELRGLSWRQRLA